MLLINILAYFFLFLISIVFAESPCGNWTSYRDEKCFMVFDVLTTFSETEKFCQGEGATFGIIRSAEEQGAVVANLKKQSIDNNIWIGIKKNGKTFLTLDGNALKYNNWANNRPLNQTDVDCVEISVDDQDKWWDVKCDKKNAVLCEKSQQWDHIKIQNVLEQIRQNYSEKIDLLEKEIVQLKQNTIPIGFIYVQLSGQSEPHSLWPETEWNNISSKYAGLFFRAEGLGSAGFGQIQDEQTKYLEVITDHCNNLASGCQEYLREHDNNLITTEFKHQAIYTGSALGTDWGINLKFTKDEIRPRNQAIRIWIRIK